MLRNGVIGLKRIHKHNSFIARWSQKLLWKASDQDGAFKTARETTPADGSLWEPEKFTLEMVLEIYSYTNWGGFILRYLCKSTQTT